MSVLESNPLQPKLGDAYLKLQLDREILAVVLLEHIQEVLVMQVEQITFMPSMPEYVLGLMNRRNKILWVIDLPQMLGMKPLAQNLQQHHIAVIRLENILLGVAIRQVRGVTRLTVEEIKSPLKNLVSNLIPYTKGSVVEQSENLLVLDTSAIINTPNLRP